MPVRKTTSAAAPASIKGRKPTLSPTRISTYLECAVKYRYIYIDKIGRFYLKARAGYSFGSTLHHVLQTFHEQGAALSAEDMKTELQQNWIAAGYETQAQEQAHREAGEQIVEAYQAAHQERITAEVQTVATEKTITCDMGRFKLTGRVDRIDRHADGSLEIVDYKSGRLETSSEEVENSLAMSIYQLIVRHMNPDTRVFATIYCLRSGVSASAELSGDARQSFEKDILALADQILDADYSLLEPEPVPACAYCDFLSRCQRFWRERERNERLESLENAGSAGNEDGPHSDFGI